MKLTVFAKKRLGLKLYPELTEFFRAVERGDRKILLRSCNGAGKTVAIACVANWKLTEHPESIVLTTASSWTQVSRSLWGEIRRQARIGNLYPEKDISTTQIKIDDKHYAIGISPTVPENAQGFHAPDVTIIVDEATGVDSIIMDALSGNATSKKSQIILACNPLTTLSYPFEAEQSGQWTVIKIDGLHHPNVGKGKEIIPGAITREWILDRLAAWSYRLPEDTDEPHVQLWDGSKWRRTSRVASRILGEWPEGDADSFIDLATIRASYNVTPHGALRYCGCDVARGGEDSTVIAHWIGNTLVKIDRFPGKDLMRTAAKLHEYYKSGYVSIGVDDTGLGGGVTDRLRQLGVPVTPVSAAASARQLLPYRTLGNQRAEMYFILEEDLRNGEIRLLEDSEFEQELAAVRLVEDPASGVYRLRPKQEIRAFLGRSPDKADAVAIGRYAYKLRALQRPLCYQDPNFKM